MMKTTVEETASILKRLTPQNQAYFMTLVRVAEIAENGVKQAIQPHKLQMQNADKQFNPDEPEEMTLYQLSLNFEDASTDPRQHRSEE